MLFKLKDLVKKIEQDNDYVYKFKSKHFAENSPPHFHIALKTKNNNCVILTFFTSKVKECRLIYKNINPKMREKIYQSLIEVKNTDFNFLTKDISIIDCNQPLCYTYNALESIIIGSVDFIKTQISDEFILQLKDAIKNSPLVSDSIKDLL